MELDSALTFVEIRIANANICGSGDDYLAHLKSFLSEIHITSCLPTNLSDLLPPRQIMRQISSFPLFSYHEDAARQVETSFVPNPSSLGGLEDCDQVDWPFGRPGRSLFTPPFRSSRSKQPFGATKRARASLSRASVIARAVPNRYDATGPSGLPGSSVGVPAHRLPLRL